MQSHHRASYYWRRSAPPFVDQAQEQVNTRDRFQFVEQLRNPWVSNEISSSSDSVAGEPTSKEIQTNVVVCEIQAAVSQPGHRRHHSSGHVVVPITASLATPAYHRPPSALTGDYCSMFLQSVFVGGALTGVALIISGISLDTQYGGRLIVLVYIGALLSLVSIILLVIHCYVGFQQNQASSARSTATRNTTIV